MNFVKISRGTPGGPCGPILMVEPIILVLKPALIQYQIRSCFSMLMFNPMWATFIDRVWRRENYCFCVHWRQPRSSKQSKSKCAACLKKDGPVGVLPIKWKFWISNLDGSDWLQGCQMILALCMLMLFCIELVSIVAISTKQTQAQIPLGTI